MPYPKAVYLQSQDVQGGYWGGARDAVVSAPYPRCTPPVCLEPAPGRPFTGDRDVAAWRPNGAVVTNELQLGLNRVATVVGTATIGGRGGLREGDQICHVGATSHGMVCGAIVRSFTVPGYGPVVGGRGGSLTDNGTAYFGACGSRGDSGGPVFTPPDARNRVRIVGIEIEAAPSDRCTRGAYSRVLLSPTIARSLGVSIFTG